jgi:hypothetical protein
MPQIFAFRIYKSRRQKNDFLVKEIVTGDTKLKNVLELKAIRGVNKLVKFLHDGFE